MTALALICRTRGRERRELFRPFAALHLAFFTQELLQTTKTGVGDYMSPKSRITLDNYPEDVSNVIIQLIRKWGDVKGKNEQERIEGLM